MGRYGKNWYGTDSVTGSDQTNYTNNWSSVDGKRVYPSSYALHVSAKGCYWSLKVLCDGRSLLTYVGPGFAVTYDPAKVILSASPLLKKGTARVVGGGVQMSSGQYALALQSSTLKQPMIPAAAEALTRKLHKRVRPCSLDGLQGDEVTVDHGDLDVVLFRLTAAPFHYTMMTMTSSNPTWRHGLEQLVRSVRFLPASTGT